VPPPWRSPHAANAPEPQTRICGAGNHRFTGTNPTHCGENAKGGASPRAGADHDAAAEAEADEAEHVATLGLYERDDCTGRESLRAVRERLLLSWAVLLECTQLCTRVYTAVYSINLVPLSSRSLSTSSAYGKVGSTGPARIARLSPGGLTEHPYQRCAQPSIVRLYNKFS
jgi:hypothetical protein